MDLITICPKPYSISGRETTIGAAWNAHGAGRQEHFAKPERHTARQLLQYMLGGLQGQPGVKLRLRAKELDLSYYLGYTGFRF